MTTREIARQWFIPGEGIDRHVISADIQRYLGNDATVRPGLGTGDNEGIQGYWIKAYRNLTSAMIADLRADSARWRQEQRMTGTREPYVGSSTYHASSAARPHRRDGDSPSVDGPYGLPTSSRDRLPVNRIPTDRMPTDRMDIDPPSVSQPERRYPQERGYQPDSRTTYPSDTRAYPSDSRQYQPEQPVSSSYGRQPVSSSYAQESRYAPSYPQPNDGAPPGYVRQGNYYVPVSSAYEPSSAIPPGRSEPPQYGNGPYGQPAPPQGRDPRDPRYGGQPDYSDPRYAYPSPAATVSSVSARDREPITSPPQPSSYGSMPLQYDQYGRPVQVPPGQPRTNLPPRESAYPSREPAVPGHPRPSTHSSREPTYGRDRSTVVSPNEDSHSSRRRRLQ